MSWRAFAATLSVIGILFGFAAAQEASTEPILAIDAGGHTNIVRGLCFTPDGKELISVSWDKTIRLWDVQSGECLRVLRPPIGPYRQGALYTAALSPDGRTLAVAGGASPAGGDPIYLIAIPSGQIERVLQGHNQAILTLAYSRDGRRLASGGYDTTARLWNPATGECERVLSGHTKEVYELVFAPDGSRLATGSIDRTARIWSIPDGRSLATLEGHQAEVCTIAWSLDGRTIATGSYDKSIRLWNADGSFRKAFPDLGNYVSVVAFTADSSGLLYALGGAPPPSWDVATIFDLATIRIRARFMGHHSTIHASVFAPGDGLVASSGGDAHDIYLWKAADGSLVRHPVRRCAGRVVQPRQHGAGIALPSEKRPLPRRRETRRQGDRHHGRARRDGHQDKGLHVSLR